MTADSLSMSQEEIAEKCGCASSDIDRMKQLGLLSEAGPDRQDINGVRLLLSLESAGIGLEAISRAVKAGQLSLEFSRSLMPDTIMLSNLTWSEVCAEAGLDLEWLSHAMIATGLPMPHPDRRAREDELALIGLVGETLRRGASEDALIDILRVFGQSTRRIAEAMREFFQTEIESRLADQGLGAAALMNAGARHRAPLQLAGLHAMRILGARFLEDVVFENVTARIQNALAEEGLLSPVCVRDPAIAFVDLADYSAMTRTIGDQASARLVARFEAIGQEAAALAEGRVVKSLGDGLLVLFADAARARQGCLDLMQRLSQAGLPEVHVGLSVGPVIRRDGDIYGDSVNLAARLATAASPSEIATDAASLGWLGGVAANWRAAGKSAFKGMPEIEVFKLSAAERRSQTRANPQAPPPT